MPKFHLTLKSGNAKTGPIPVSITSADTCPDACPLKKNGCYADSVPLAIHWRKVSNSTHPNHMTETEFLAAIDALPAGQLWRHNQAGDLPSVTTSAGWQYIRRDFLRQLTQANSGKRGFTYTHHVVLGQVGAENCEVLAEANANGFTVNASANSAAQAIEYKRRMERDIPVVCVVPATETRKQWTQEGQRFVTCPATYKDGMTCAKCGLCQRANRDAVIAFPVHGPGAKKAHNATQNS